MAYILWLIFCMGLQLGIGMIFVGFMFMIIMEDS